MTKKSMNNLFLDYLLQSERDIEKQVEKWEENLKDKIDEVSESINEHMVFMMACWGEIGWCLPSWKERNIKLGNVLADIKNNISINEIDEGLAKCFKEREIESLTILIQRKIPDSENKKLDLAFELYLKQEYFASATLLAGLIDSTSINQFMKTNAKYFSFFFFEMILIKEESKKNIFFNKYIFHLLLFPFFPEN